MKIDPKGRIWNDWDINDSINSAILQVQKAWDYNWQENQAEVIIPSVIDQQEYSLPLDLQRIKLTRFDWRELFSTTKTNLKVHYREFTWGTPLRYYVNNSVLGIHPFPKVAQDIDIDYNKILPELVNDSDLLVYSDDFIKAIVLYAAYELFSSIWNTENLNRAQIRFNRYSQEEEKLINTYLIPDGGQLVYKMDYPYNTNGYNNYNKYYNQL